MASSSDDAARLARLQQELADRKQSLEREMQRLRGGSSSSGQPAAHGSKSHHRRGHGHSHRSSSHKHGGASKGRRTRRERDAPSRSRSPSQGRRDGSPGRRHRRNGHGHRRGHGPRASPHSHGGDVSSVDAAQAALDQARQQVQTEGRLRLERASAELLAAQEQLQAKTESLHAARTSLADKQRRAEATHTQLSTLMGMTRDLLQMLRPAAGTSDGAAAASSALAGGAATAALLGSGAGDTAEGEHAAIEDFIEARMRTIAGMLGTEGSQEHEPRSLTEQAWTALQANISEWERGRAEELAAAGVGGLEALAAVHVGASEAGHLASGDGGGGGVHGGADGTRGGREFAAGGGGGGAGGTLDHRDMDADVHRLSAVLMQSVPHVA